MRDTLGALATADYPSDLLEIVVVNNGSTDSTAQVVSQFPRVRAVEQRHSGVSKSRNHGARVAAGDVLLFLDDDIIVAPDTIRRLIELREAHADYVDCIVAGKAEFPSGLRSTLRTSAFGRFRLGVEDRSQSEWFDRWGRVGRIYPPAVPTQNLSVGAEFFQQLGGFDERFPSIGGEDHDLCLRARKAGALVVLDHDIRLVHNDQHRDLQAICRREERGAVATVCLARKHPDIPWPEALSVNGPLQFGDPPRLIARKTLRAALSRDLALRLAHRVVTLAERLRPDGGWPLESLYRAVVGLYVFRGTRRGLRLTAHETWDPSLRDI